MSLSTFWAERPPQRPCPGRSELPIKGRLEESLCEGPSVRIARAGVLAPEDLVSLRFFARSCWGPQLITSGRGKCLQTGHPAGWKVTPLKVWRRRGPAEDLRPPCQTASWSKRPRPACHQLTVWLPVSLAPQFVFLKGSHLTTSMDGFFEIFWHSAYVLPLNGTTSRY